MKKTLFYPNPTFSHKFDYYTNVNSPYYHLYFIDEGRDSISNTIETMQLEAGYMYIIPSFTLCNLSYPDYLSQYFIHFLKNPLMVFLYSTITGH